MSSSSHRFEPELLATPPRRAGMARALRRRYVLTLLVPILLVGGLGLSYLVFFKIPGDATVRALKERGGVVEGRITRVWAQRSRGSSRLRADYQFRVGGQAYGGTIDGAAPSQEPGVAVAITYLPESPAVHRVGLVDDETSRASRRDGEVTAQILLSLVVVVLVVAGPIVLFNWLGSRRNVGLVRHGTAAIATVTSLTPYGIRYTFEIPGRGNAAGEARFLSKVDGKRLEAGSELTVLYRPGLRPRFALYREIGDIEWPTA